MKRTSCDMRSTTLVEPPLSTNARLDTTVRTPAARQADNIAAAPAEMFSRHGTTPNACSPMNATSEAIAFGISSATCVSPGASRDKRTPECCRTHHHPIVADRHALDVLGDRRSGPMSIARIQQRGEQAPAGLLRAEHRIHHHVLQGATDHLTALAWRQVLAVCAAPA